MRETVTARDTFGSEVGAFSLVTILTLWTATLPLPDILAAREERVRALVRQLGDARYRERESAHKALLKEGEKILPLLDKLPPARDFEIRSRLDAIRDRLTRTELVMAWDGEIAVHRFKPDRPLWRDFEFILSGSVRLVQRQRVVEMGSAVSAHVELYEVKGRDILELMQTWELGREVMTKAIRRDARGDAIVLRLPWSNYRPDIEKVFCIVRLSRGERVIVEDSQVIRITHTDLTRQTWEGSQIRVYGGLGP